MATGTEKPTVMVTPEEHSAAPTPKDPLARVCELLNQAQARYVVVGAQACILHGLVRTTEDVDLLIEESDDNYDRVLRALCGLEDRAAARFADAVAELWRAHSRVLAVVQRRALPFWAPRLSGAPCARLELDATNRDALPSRIRTILLQQ